MPSAVQIESGRAKQALLTQEVIRISDYLDRISSWCSSQLTTRRWNIMALVTGFRFEHRSDYDDGVFL